MDKRYNDNHLQEEKRIVSGYLFDLDGVLIDSESQYTRIWEEIDEEYPTGVDNFAIRIKGTTLHDILSTYFPEDMHATIKAALDEKEGAMTYSYTSGAERLLRSLQERGHGTVLVTSSNLDKMKKLDSQLPELTGYFTDIITGDRVSRSKPDPEGYLLGAGIIKADPRNCVVFEDSLQGVKAGRASGSYVIGVAGTCERTQLSEYAEIVVDSLEEIDLDMLEEKLKTR